MASSRGYEPLPTTSGPAHWRPRRWRGHWLKCCGEGSPEDVMGCCLAWSLPSCTFALNATKVLHARFWHQLALYFLLLTLGSWILNGLDWGIVWACRPTLAASTDADGNPTLPLVPANPEACRDFSAAAGVFKGVAGVLVWVALAVWAIFVGGRRRTQLREELGIPITDEGKCCSACHCSAPLCNDDTCLHFWCIPCALAQETRTILHEEATGQLQPRLLDGGYQGLRSKKIVAGTPVAQVEGMQRAAPAAAPESAV